VHPKIIRETRNQSKSPADDFAEHYYREMEQKQRFAV
jgi:hypothetical protein